MLFYLSWKLVKMLVFFYSQVFCGKIPKDVFEDELIPLFEKCGQIWDLRLMMDPLTGLNRGYCFVTYCDKDGASEAVKQVCFLYYLCQFIGNLNLTVFNHGPAEYL